MNKNYRYFARYLTCAAFIWVTSAPSAAEQRPATTSTGNVFLKAHSLLREGKYPEAAAEYDAIALKYQGEGQPAKSYRLDALYYAGMALIRANYLPEANKRFEEILAASVTGEPAVEGSPLGFRRTILSYGWLMESATKAKDYRRARELAEAGNKKISDQLALLERMTQTRVARAPDLALRTWLSERKPLFDWKVAHPDQIESRYYNALRKANAVKAGATSSTALTRNPDSATSGTCSGSSCACGCSATTATATAPCCKP